MMHGGVVGMALVLSLALVSAGCRSGGMTLGEKLESAGLKCVRDDERILVGFEYESGRVQGVSLVILDGESGFSYAYSGVMTGEVGRVQAEDLLRRNAGLREAFWQASEGFVSIDAVIAPDLEGTGLARLVSEMAREADEVEEALTRNDDF